VNILVTAGVGFSGSHLCRRRLNGFLEQVSPLSAAWDIVIADNVSTGRRRGSGDRGLRRDN
jgi:hypothetical protein